MHVSLSVNTVKYVSNENTAMCWVLLFPLASGVTYYEVWPSQW